MRHLAAHRVEGEGYAMDMAVVTIHNGSVVDIRPLCGEQPFTEWVGGTLTLRRHGQQLKVYKDGKLI